MESLPIHPILQFHSDTMETLRKKYNLDKPGDLDKAIDILKEWLQQQEHLTKKDYSRDFLERTIIFLKGSVERSKSQIDKLCTFKSLLPRFFEKVDVKTDFKIIDGVVIQALLPRLTKEHYRVFMPNIISKGLTTKKLFNGFQYCLMMCEYFKNVDYCDGLIVISDFPAIEIIDEVHAMNLVDIREMLTILTKGYDIRLKSINLITPSKAVDLLISVMKPCLGNKVAGRIHVHKNLESLYEQVPREVLPADYGGELKETFSELCEKWNKFLGSENNVEFLREMMNARTDETLRQTDIFNEQYMGMVGSFRYFSVD